MITITYNTKNDRLVLLFAYDSDLIQKVRALTGRAYDQSAKTWSIPIESYEELNGWHIQLLPEARARIERYAGQQQIYAHLKTDPTAYTGTLPLFDFQKCGAEWLRAMPSALLASEPGLGKTAQAITAVSECSRILVLCPASIKYNWLNECALWASARPAIVIQGTPQQRAQQWSQYSDGFAICNYEQLLRDMHWLSTGWDAIICDEAQKIQNHRAISVKNLYKLQTNKKIAMTGTPISNSVKDIYGIFNWLKNGYLGTMPQFEERYYELDFWGNIVGYKNLDHLAHRVEPYMLRHTKAQVIKDFASKTIQTIRFDLTAHERARYDAIKKEIADNLDKIDETTLAVAVVKLIRLRQASDSLALLDSTVTEPSSKMLALREILEPIIQNGSKVVIFSEFAEMVKLLEAYLKDYKPLILIGETAIEQRQKNVDIFNNSDENSVMILSSAGSVGLNLQKKCNYMVNYDMPWSVGKYEQRIGRIWRIGQEMPVTIYNLIGTKTADEQVYGTLFAKQKLSDSIIDTAESLSKHVIQQILD